MEVFITPVIGCFMTFFLCEMSASPEGKAQAKLKEKFVKEL